MKRIMGMLLRNILLLPYIAIKLVYYAKHADKYTTEQKFEHLRFVERHADKGARIKIDIHGRENVPKKNGFIYYPNHQGMFDGFAMVAASPVPFSPIIKQELMKIPLVKSIFICFQAFPMDRKDIRQSMGVILQMAEAVKNGQNGLIFAEGTRSKNGNEVQEFKGGSFKCAVKAKCPIVPVALIDSFQPMDTNSLKPVTVQVHILPPLEYEEYKEMHTTEIAALVQSRIVETIKNNLREK